VVKVLIGKILRGHKVVQVQVQSFEKAILRVQEADLVQAQDLKEKILQDHKEGQVLVQVIK
jgi:hypothetical protein